MHRPPPLRVLAALTAVGAVACGPPPTLSQIQTGVFAKSCATSGCHAGASPAQGLSLEGSTYAKLVGASSTMVPTKKLVVGGRPETSFLFEKISVAAPSSGTRMPPSPPLSAADVDLIKQWIAAGAKND